jgi:hypothetical protein
MILQNIFLNHYSKVAAVSFESIGLKLLGLAGYKR